MARRNRYFYNGVHVNFGDLFNFVPAAYFEVVPGETISGSMRLNVASDVVNHQIKNMFYVDAFAFYCPFRLMWDDWPDFISGETPASAFPTVGNTWAFNFEPNHTLWGGAAYTEHPAWHRYMYNLVFRTYFDDRGDQPSSLTGNTVQNVYARTGRF